MKKGVKIFFSIFIMVAYIFATGQNLYHSHTHHYHANSNQSESFSIQKINGLSLASGNENAFANSLRMYYNGEKKLTNDFKRILESAEYYYRTSWFHYLDFEKNSFVRFSPPDIVFPFHYFW
ncbi:MAG: hypothetical protein KF882_00645 [Bacteroidia bacterium]|nr:hypothetical protein [Bacteroidia bacterium]MCO5252900.1 hypothetical protein [Bacteroidota bacterium]